MRKLLIHMKSVYQIPQKIKRLTDRRQKNLIPQYNIVMMSLIAFLLQYESFHMVFSSPESMHRRLRHIIKGRIPKIDAVRDTLSGIEPEEIQHILESVVARVKRNRVLASGMIGGYRTAAIDGVELFSSSRKSCPECLKRRRSDGTWEFFHRSVVYASIGGDLHVVFGQEMLKPRDTAEKDEGEQTGAKRLIRRLHAQHGHLADVIVGDALYLNAPFLNTLSECGLDAVIRLKDENRLIFQDAAGLFEQGEGKQAGFQTAKQRVEVWSLRHFQMEQYGQELRVVKFRETPRKMAGQSREVWLVTTLLEAPAQTLWEMMRRRWDIENNVFHQLKTYYHAGHCFCHRAVEVIFLLILLAFNMRELYLFRRLRNFSERNISRKSVTMIFRDQLLLEDFKTILYMDSG